MRPDSYPVEICLPPICDEAVVEIHDFLNDFLRLFKCHLGTQDPYTSQEDRSFDNLVHHNPYTRPPDDEPPFS